MKVVFLDNHASPAILNIKEFVTYKIVAIGSRYYVWAADWNCWKHADIAEKFTNGCLDKVKAAGSFSTRSDNKMVIGEYHSTSLFSHGVKAHMSGERFDELAILLNLTVDEEY